VFPAPKEELVPVPPPKGDGFEGCELILPEGPPNGDCCAVC
jgi:hypothetical protein